MSDTSTALDQLEAAAAAGKLSEQAVANIRSWLSEPRFAAYADEVAAHLEEGKFDELSAAFWTTIPFGTGGRRGMMYPIGSAVVNERTIGESAQGLAEYVKSQAAPGTNFSVAIAHDTRHRSHEFARLSAEVMVAAGFTVYYLSDPRSTPALSFTVRLKRCCCGIMITASHNPPSDNGFKAYWKTGGQLVPPHDRGVIDRVMQVDEFARVDFDEAVAANKIVLCQEEVDAAFLAELQGQAFAGPRDVKVIYSPLHGVGSSAVLPALAADGFADVEEFAPHAEPSGDFPNVPDHVSNPENPAVFDAMIERGRQVGADLVLATDPDCDRVGCAAPLTTDSAGAWATFTGNQIGALLADFVLGKRKAAGTLSPDHYVVKTLVTTELIRRIADGYGVRTCGKLLVGFKWIGETMDEQDPSKFVLGAEESYGYLVGEYARDKDGAVAAMLLAELAADCRAAGESMHERLTTLFARHGCHAERTISIMMPGEAGMENMKKLMAGIRSEPPTVLADLQVAQVRDYGSGTITLADGSAATLDGPRGDMVILDFAAEGNYVAARPSGTEPKVKFYLFAYHPPEDGADVARVRAMLEDRLDALEFDFRKLADAVS
ncbi:MAG: phospho-sugar mutase [Planctomycetota bacterium]|nr:MAG: phospho-sugar mutase [Planctomycetota bacterium]